MTIAEDTTLAQAFDIVAAAHTLASLLAENTADMYESTMATLTCTEANALVDLVRQCGHEEAANALAEHHANADDEGDEHYPWIVEEVRASDLRDGQTYREFSGDPTEIVKVAWQGDTVLVTGKDESYAALDADEVVERLTHPRRDAA